jgi:hypothetical protein
MLRFSAQFYGEICAFHKLRLTVHARNEHHKDQKTWNHHDFARIHAI